MKKEPLFIYCARGIDHVIMAIWSINSLKNFNYNNIQVVVGKQKEKLFFNNYLPEVKCNIIKVDLINYKMWAWRPFALSKLEIKDQSQIVICDTDIIWHKDPKTLLTRFNNKPWVHKITSLDPGEFFDYRSLSAIPKRRIGLRTMIAYKNRNHMTRYPNFHLNCGLFMLKKNIFDLVLEKWVRAIKSLPANEMIMTEALLAIIYAELKIHPISDYKDIKHINIKHRKIDSLVTNFLYDKNENNLQTGYQTAKHYFGDQRKKLISDVLDQKLDTQKLLRKYKNIIIFKKLKYFFYFPFKFFK